MPHPPLENMAARIIRDVRDEVLDTQTPHFFGTWSVAQDNATYERLVANLGEDERDVLWQYLDHNRLTSSPF
jgi:hypothetical protein